MDVLVTGGRGFVGLNIAQQLALTGNNVWIVDRSPVDGWVAEFLSATPSIQHLSTDLARTGVLREVFGEHALDAVVHAAVVTATTESVEREQARDIVDSNVGATVEVLDFAVACGAERFIYVSSPSAIGDVDATEAVAEDVSPRPTSLYGITKLASEQIVARWADLYGLSAASVRIAQPYGPGERATSSRARTSPIWEWLTLAANEEQLPTGPLDRARDWTYVDDTAEGIARMVSAGSLNHRLYHLGTGVDVTVGDVVEQLRDRFGDIGCDTTLAESDLNPNIAGPGRPPLDVGRFAREFGWHPSTTLPEGMSRYFTWWDQFASRIG